MYKSFEPGPWKEVESDISIGCDLSGFYRLSEYKESSRKIINALISWMNSVRELNVFYSRSISEKVVVIRPLEMSLLSYKISYLNVGRSTFFVPRNWATCRWRFRLLFAVKDFLRWPQVFMTHEAADSELICFTSSLVVLHSPSWVLTGSQ